ncbi:MAG: Cache 3/Cache 2 fusion domain-containing protein [Elusimicrobia bacterium]|nr:Cache 3/Cache 2 fusion domain-containing protein [Elusimicrobiota bacterium]
MAKKIRNIRIFYKFLVILLLLSAIPLLAVGWRLIQINKLGLQDVILELHTNEVESIAESIETYMEGLREKLDFIVSSQGESSIDWALNARVLRSLIASSNDFLTISMLDAKGSELTKYYPPLLEGKVKLEDFSKDKTFLAAKETGNFTISPLYYWGNRPCLNVAYPFTENFYLYITANLERLNKKVHETTIGKTGFVYIVDSKGNIVMHRDPSLAEGSVSVIDRPIVQEVLSRRLLGSKEYTTKEGKEVVGAYAPVAALDWGVIIQQDKNEAYYSVRRMRKNAYILLVVVLILASVTGYFMTQNLTGPIIKLTGVARNIASGSFDVDIVSKWLKKVKIKDELVELAHTFVVMTEQLKRYNDMQADKMNAILFSIADGIIMTDYTGKVILSNRRVKELLKIAPSEDLIDKNIQDIIKKKEISDSLKEAAEKRENIIKEIDFSSDRLIKFLRTDTSLVSHSDSGAEIGTVTVIRDITLEKELEQLKDDFMHAITHDLRSPMTSIRGFLEFLLDGTAGELNEQQIEFLKIIDESSARLLGMINDILDVAKIEAGSMPIELEEVDLVQLTASVIKSLLSQAQKDKVELKVDEVNKIDKITVDKNLLHRVITNLISNSLKFTPEGGDVTVRLENMDDKIQVSVIDTGEGMPREYLEKIFDKFERVKGSKGRRKGTGLGLTITKYIIEAHKGKIWAESELGKGSKFTFWLPKNLKAD